MQINSFLNPFKYMDNSNVKKMWETSENNEENASDPQIIQEIMHDDIPSNKQSLKESK
tara:strand:+ start:683 stop:856 length:174 start_codon:yes stop_codon:yes gene_type:complete